MTASSCDKCGEKIPDTGAHQVIHLEQEHPEEYQRMVESYYEDLENYDD